MYDLAQGPDGRLYTLHRNQAEVMRWTPDGRPDGVIGRQGEGPGEFRSPRQLGFFGDSLWVMDSRTVRVSYFDGDGGLLGTRNLPLNMEADPEQPWKSPPRPRRPLRDGTFYGAAPAWSEQIVRGELTSALHVRMSADGEVLDTLWDQPYRPTDVLGLLRDGGGTFGPQPFGDQPLMVITSRGITILHRRVDGSEAEPSLHLAALDWSGDTLTSRRIPYRPEPLPSAEVERAAKEQAAELHGFVGEPLGISLAQMEADVADAIYGPSHHPFVARMLVTEQGQVWLERTGTEAGTWLVLTAPGDPTGRVTLPEGLRVLRIDGDTLWGVETDDLDVNYVVQYRLVETPS